MLVDKNDLAKLKDYNDFVRKSEYGSICQDTHWAIVKDTWEAVYFYKEKEGKIIGALSVIYIHDKELDSNFYYAPRGPVCDLYDIDLVVSLIDEAKEYIGKNGGFLLRLDPEVVYDKDLVEAYRKRGLNFIIDEKSSSQPTRSLILEIKGRNIDQIFKGFSKNTRKHIRHSYKSGITSQLVGREKIKEFAETIKIMAERAGIGYRDEAYFRRLFDAFPNDIALTFTSLGEELLSVSMMICYGRKCFSLYGASNNKLRNLSQNYQINYEEVKYAVEHGYKEYDMGGIFSVDEDDGLYSFKRKFTEDNVKNWIGELDVIFDKEKYLKFRRRSNPDFEIGN
ncbi:MAG: peptidoglycan bridge formation glycyltransferase FemA/FemB family protein [Peptoniphilaceae bacterium]|nr:peptidoglycan bridge formation glycyltransferase FemA/FemB family protein [Peptoniphilaceae bacterium]MDY6019031.1 peptidoglycan bridge formation glycyltransferase FemA/FemB family protein [Anaerococcus sp.]